LFQTIVGAPPIPDRNRRVKIATRRLQAQGFLRTLSENRELERAGFVLKLAKSGNRESEAIGCQRFE
jgi:hypothetical protein